MDELTQQLRLRDQMRRKLALQKTPSQRMSDMRRLQETTRATLRSSPNGYAHFLRRNFKARAVAVQKPDVR